MSHPTLFRRQILTALSEALRPLPFIHAMWEGGSAAFDRTDEWSDIDVQLEVDDDRVQEALAAVERILIGLSPIQDRLDMPAAQAGGYSQVFYRLRDTSEHLLVDLCVIPRSCPSKFLEPEIHGRAVFHFNKADALAVPHLDYPAHMAKIKARLERVRGRYTMFRSMVEKELNRRNHTAAVDLYYRLVLDSLVDALRILHAPEHFDFKVPYLNHDLPAEVFARLEDLFFVVDGEDLRWKFRRAERWLQETLDEIDLGRVEARLRAGRD
jgi:hypothetical protein